MADGRRLFMCAVVALAVALGIGGCGSDDAGAEHSLLVVGTEMAFEAPASVEAGSYEVTFRNDGAVAHELAFRNPAGEVVTRRSIGPRSNVTMAVELTAGTWELACHEIGHYEAGMHKPLIVESG